MSMILAWCMCRCLELLTVVVYTRSTQHTQVFDKQLQKYARQNYTMLFLPC